MKKTLVYLVLFSLLVQIGCSGITQIPYPVDESKSENEIRQLNYFGERLNSTIQFTNSIEVEAYWLKMKDDKIYFLTEGLNDTTSVSIDEIKMVRFYSRTMGCVRGELLSLGIMGLTVLFVEIFVRDKGYTGYPIAIGGSFMIVLGFIIGVNFLGDIEFNFVQK